MVEYHGKEYEDMMAKITPMKRKKNYGNNIGSCWEKEKFQSSPNHLPKKDVSQVMCFDCKNKGHYASKCIEKKKNISQVQCFSCGVKGHHVNDCPQKLDLSRAQCHKCKNMGHNADMCQN